jgi:small-conductance mechanosensitive channel
VLAFLEANPEIVSVAILAVGVLCAQLTRYLVGRGLATTETFLARSSTSDATILTPVLISSSKNFAFWAVFAFSIVLALRAIGVDVFEGALNQVGLFVPRLLMAIAIVGVGHLLGLLARALVARLSETIEPDSLAPRMVHGVIMVLAVVIGFQQLGIDLTFLAQLMLALLVVGLGGIALAFGLGAKDHVSNLLGRSELDRYAVGERIRIDGAEGIIVEIHATGVELATGEGVLTIPASSFAHTPVLKVTESDDVQD